MGKYEKMRKIVHQKLVDKTEDRDYSELSMELFGKQLASDECRKRMYGMKTVIDAIEEENLSNVEDEDILKEIEEKRLELEKERKKLQATKIEYNRNIRDESRRELLYENIKETQERLPIPDFKDIPFIKDNQGEYLLCWADLHYGANFISENNEYSPEICRYRMEYLASKVKQKCVDLGINHLTILSLGDCIQGMIHLSDIKINDIPVVESVVEVSRLIGQVINSISEVTTVTYIHTMASNHTQTRPFNSKQYLSQEDLEVVIGNYIRDILVNNERVEVILSNKDYNSFALCNQNILALHGHQVKNVNNAVKDYSMLHRKFYDLVLLGHLHGGASKSVGEIDGNTEVKVVPSIVGSDPYADSLKVGSKSMAKMYKIEVNCGITEEYTFVLN